MWTNPLAFFGELLLPMQDFAQSFILVSFDYLIHVHELDAANYEDVYERTIDAFVQLRIWADRARDEIKSSISDAMHDKPCKNGLAIDNQKSEWSAKFLSTHVYPIDSYIDRLAELNNAFTGDLFSWLGCYKDTGDRAMVHLKNGVTTTMECYDLCMQDGYSLFGLQYSAGGQCFCSNDKGEAMRFGESDSCDGHGRGGNWALDIYQVNGIVIGNVVLQYGVKYAIKSVSSGYYLDGTNQTDSNPVLTNRDPSGDKFLHWTIVQTNVENQFALRSVSSGFYLDGRDQNYNTPLTTNRDPTDDYYLQWTFEKTNGGTYATEYIGCYKDTANRALRYVPHQWGGYNPDTCSTACKDYKYFAVQAGGYCFCDDDYDHATRYGEGGGCPASKMGAGWRNDLFLNEMPNNVAIKSVSSQKYLDGRSPNRKNPLLTNGNPMDDKFLQWQFIAQTQPTQTIYDSGPHKELIPVQGSNPLFYLDMTDNMEFSMDIVTNSFPSGVASIFHCGTSNTVRTPVYGSIQHPMTLVAQVGMLHLVQ